MQSSIKSELHRKLFRLYRYLQSFSGKIPSDILTMGPLADEMQLLLVTLIKFNPTGARVFLRCCDCKWRQKGNRWRFSSKNYWIHLAPSCSVQQIQNWCAVRRHGSTCTLMHSSDSTMLSSPFHLSFRAPAPFLFCFTSAEKVKELPYYKEPGKKTAVVERSFNVWQMKEKNR